MKLYRNAVILVIIVVLLGGAYYFINKKNASKVDEGDSASDTIKLTDFTSDQVESLTLENPDGTFVLVKKDDDWVISSPADFKGDADVLSSLVINAGSITADKLVEESAQDLSIYGLDDPVRITVKLKEESDKDAEEGKSEENEKTGAAGEVKIEIGDLTPTKGGYYAKLSGESKVYVISSYTGEKLVVGKNELKTKELYTIAAEDITKLSMDRNGENLFVSEKDADGNWTLTQPIKGNVNTSALSPMLDALVATKVSEYVEEKPSDLSKYGLDKPSYALDFSTAKAGAFKLLLGDEKTKGSELYAMLDGGNDVFVIDSTAYTFLDKPLTEIVEVFAYIVNIDQVKEIELTMDGKTTKMTVDVYKDAEGKTDNDKDKFTIDGMDASGKDENDDQPFRKFYQDLIGIGLDEIDVNGQPAGDPEISIKYTLKSAPGTMKVDFISKDANYYYVVRNGEYSGLLVKKNKKEFGVVGMKESLNTLMDFVTKEK